MGCWIVCFFDFSLFDFKLILFDTDEITTWKQKVQNEIYKFEDVIIVDTYQNANYGNFS